MGRLPEVPQKNQGNHNGFSNKHEAWPTTLDAQLTYNSGCWVTVLCYHPYYPQPGGQKSLLLRPGWYLLCILYSWMVWKGTFIMPNRWIYSFCGYVNRQYSNCAPTRKNTCILNMSPLEENHVQRINFFVSPFAKWIFGGNNPWSLTHNHWKVTIPQKERKLDPPSSHHFFWKGPFPGCYWLALYIYIYIYTTHKNYMCVFHRQTCICKCEYNT